MSDNGKRIDIGISCTCTKCGHTGDTFIPPGEFAKKILDHVQVEINAVVQADREYLAAQMRAMVADLDPTNEARTLIELIAESVVKRREAEGETL